MRGCEGCVRDVCEGCVRGVRGVCETRILVSYWLSEVR